MLPHAIWDATRDLGFPVNRDRDLVKSARDTTKERQTNFFILPKILYFRRLTQRNGTQWWSLPHYGAVQELVD
jgi:hypothetical protein